MTNEEIWAEEAATGGVTYSVSGKNERGISQTFTPTAPMTGDLLDEDAIHEAISQPGTKLVESGKTASGKVSKRTAKELSENGAKKFAANFFGITLKPTAKKRSGAADTVKPEPSENGKHTS